VLILAAVLLAVFQPWRGLAQSGPVTSPTSPGPTVTSRAPTAPSSSTTPVDSGAHQAAAVDGLLRQSAQARKGAAQAVNRLAGCQAGRSDETALRRGTSDREQLIAKLAATRLNALPGGADLASLLTQAWQESAAADRDYLAAYQAVRGRCTLPRIQNNASYQRGGDHSAAATGLKKTFVKTWNPIAQDYGLTQWTDQQI
jgi:hypothetical protein